MYIINDYLHTQPLYIYSKCLKTFEEVSPKLKRLCT